jgi:hypothetical protein
MNFDVRVNNRYQKGVDTVLDPKSGTYPAPYPVYEYSAQL